jgi:hypothetical protein
VSVNGSDATGPQQQDRSSVPGLTALLSTCQRGGRGFFN